MKRYVEALNILRPTNIIQKTISGDIIDTQKGFLSIVPLSTWKVDWTETKVLKNYVGDIGTTRSLKNPKIHFWTLSKDDKNKPSIFNPYIAKLILQAYAPDHADIYDPFAGGGTRAIISATMGHNYTGCEIRQEEVDSINKRGDELNLKYKIINDDSATIVHPNTFNFSFTCPPYYNLEEYDGGSGDISMAKSYHDFLDMLRPIIKNTYTSLKDDSFSIWVVNNFRNKKGDLRHFNGDFVRIAEEIGFKLYDEIIVNSYANIAQTRAKQFRVSKKMVRFHEYILVFRKYKG